MALIAIDIRCPDCEARWDDLVERSEQNNTFQCPYCGLNNAVKTLSAPNTTRASYVDGTKRKGWSEIREINKLKQESAQSRDSKKKEIAREIRKLGGRVD